MAYQTSIRGEQFSFADLREVFARANEEKSGDRLAGLAARSERERVAAKLVLADVPLGDIVDRPLLDPDKDDVSRFLLDTLDQKTFQPLRSMTVGEFREQLLEDALGEQVIRALQPALHPDVAAAVAKLMSNKDLVLAASKIRNVTHCRNTMGQRGVLGVRVQPNHPADDLGGILLSAVDGLLFGCGDAVVGVNPATESVETVSAILHGLNRLIDTLAVPTQACCLAHITTQLACLERGAPVDLLFQSIAGTQAANTSFGVSLSLLREGRERVRESHRVNIRLTRFWRRARLANTGLTAISNWFTECLRHRRRNIAWVGDNVMYFETGQGSALSADAHHGLDQLTLEARAYGVARAFEPFLVNSVVGFIGPEYLSDERQIVRAGLEDHFMGKLLGLPMGVDVCYTNHAAADQNSADNLLLLLALAGCNYFMGVPCTDDVMLNYQSTSYHDAAGVRQVLGLRPAPEFLAWLEERGIFCEGRLARGEEERRKRLLQGVERLLEHQVGEVRA